MARPAKQGLDYFPLDVHIDDKLRFIKAKFGWEGYGIIIGLFQHIYGQGYWCSWSGDDDFLYAEENRIDRALLIKIVNEALKRALFSQELYEKHQILTSCGIQKRYAEIVKRRKVIDIVSEYVLIGDALSKHNANIMQASNKHDASKSTQTETESKPNRKEIKLKEKETNDPLSYQQEPFESPCEDGSKDTTVQDAFLDCEQKLGMSKQEIIKAYEKSNQDHFAEAVRFAIEKQEEDKEVLKKPVGFLVWASNEGKTSKRTRNACRNVPEVDDYGFTNLFPNS